MADASQAPAATSDRDLRLLQEYTRACRQRGGIVLGLGDDVVMLNDHARQALSPADQAVLLSHATELLERRRSSGTVTVELPSGAVARMSCRRVGPPEPGHGRTADGIASVKLVAPDATAAAVPPPRPPMPLPGLVGNGGVWWRACRQAETAYLGGDWLALEGESGAGKLALVRAVHRRHHPAAPFHVLDAADGGHDLLAGARGELTDGTGMLVLRHVDTLDASQVHTLATALGAAQTAGRGKALRVAVTLDRAGEAGAVQGEADPPADGEPSGTDTGPAGTGTAPAYAGYPRYPGVAGDVPNGYGDLLRLFPAVVAVPPLRHHSEDLGELIPFFLGRLRRQGQVSCSPAAMQLLVRYAWPGNAAQLWQVLKQAVQRRRVGQIMPDDLPSEVWTVSRRVLSPLESIERDAIVQSLFDHGGSKIRAARALGLSRATMYRRIREYGIVT
jgi:sigma-54 dependent transcriptional regulator, acetoin dehydrogenase operon transcriptional activator AcoR